MSWITLFKRAHKAARKRGKFKDITSIKWKEDIEREDYELYDELWDSYREDRLTGKAINEAFDGIVIRINLLKENDVNLLEAFGEYVKYQEERKD